MQYFEEFWSTIEQLKRFWKLQESLKLIINNFPTMQLSQKGFIPLCFGSNILNFDQLPFLSPLSQNGVTYLFRKPNAMPVESKPETGWISILS